MKNLAAFCSIGNSGEVLILVKTLLGQHDCSFNVRELKAHYLDRITDMVLLFKVDIALVYDLVIRQNACMLCAEINFYLSRTDRRYYTDYPFSCI